MNFSPLKWTARNISALLLAFILAVIVWVSAVVTSNPNIEETSRPIPIEILGQDPNLLLMGEPQSSVRLTIEAPTSIWNQLNENPDLMKAWVDLSGLGAGDHDLKVNVLIDGSPLRLIRVDPAEMNVRLETLLTKEIPIDLIVNGEPPLGYKKETPQMNPGEVQISGPQSAVSKVFQAKVVLDIAGASQTVTSSVPIDILDENGAPVTGVSINPNQAAVTQPISLLRGFRNVAVKVVTLGQVANGYRLSNITVTPPTVTVSSADPLVINELPGFVETLPIDISDLTDDIEVNVGLNLPEGITLVRDPSVLVQVNVAAIESSLSIPLPVEILGLPPGLQASISPASVDIIVSGPIPILDTLSPASFRMVIDLTNMDPGIYQITPILDLIPNQVQIESIIPERVEVLITIAPTTTPVPESITPTP
ncbi:MAG: CdaR family protein [Chloroflexota bacterium]|nr:CdaR family protein [Chloroflexota bacterium]